MGIGGPTGPGTQIHLPNFDFSENAMTAAGTPLIEFIKQDGQYGIKVNGETDGITAMARQRYTDSARNHYIAFNLATRGGTPPAVTEYTVTFHANGGTFPGGATQHDGGTYPEGVLISGSGVPTATRSGYALQSGWYRDPACTTLWNFATDTMPAADIILYANWTRDTDPGGGGGESSTPPTPPTTPETPTDPGDPNDDDDYTPIGDEPTPLSEMPDLTFIFDDGVPLVGLPETGSILSPEGLLRPEALMGAAALLTLPAYIIRRRKGT